MANDPFTSGQLPDGSGPIPRQNMTGVALAQERLQHHEATVAAQWEAQAEQRRLAEASEAYQQALEAERALKWAQHQSAQQAGQDSFKARMRRGFVEAQRREAERLGVPFQMPVEEVPEPPPQRQLYQTEQYTHAEERQKMRENFVRNQIAEAERLGLPIPDDLR